MMNRRSIFERGALMLAGMVFAPAQAALAKAKESATPHFVMVIDLRRCNGCQACVVRCGQEHGNTPTQHRTVVYQGECTVAKEEKVLNLPLLCNQCNKPSCVSVCPTHATYKIDNGTVVVDSDLCIGCGACAQACPYPGTRFIDEETQKIDKCNFCVHRTSVGLLPACVETCTGSARHFGDINDPKSYVSQLLEKHPSHVLETPLNTEPNVYYIGLPEVVAHQRFPLNQLRTWER